MDKERNINLTLTQASDDSQEVAVCFSTILRQAKKYLLPWIIAAAIMALLVSSMVMLFRTSSYSGDITALISYDYDGIEKGLDPSGGKLDVNKIKSPSVIESALTNLNIPLGNVENIRRSISIKGVVSEEELNKKNMYQSVYEKGGTAALSAIEDLIENGDFPTYYIISLKYNTIGFDLDTSKQILDAILNSYKNYFFETYGYNKALGSEVSLVDYKDYDYSEAVDVFRSTLNSLREYVGNLEETDSVNFRSSSTGYSFGDLLLTINTLQDSDLDSISSYIIVNNVTNNKELLISYYEYKVEQLEREIKVYKAKLDSISDSISKYEKDSILIFGDAGENGSDSSETSYVQASAEYDALIEQKIDVQEDVSTTSQDIGFYNDRIKALKASNTVSSEEDEKIVAEKLEALNSKISNLINTVNETSDEYYEKVSFAKAYNILVPAIGSEPVVVTGDLVMPILIAEGVLFVIYAAAAFLSAIAIDNRRNKIKNASSDDTEEI